MDDGRHYTATFHAADDPDARGWHLQAHDAEGSFITSWWYVSLDACKRFVEEIESARMNTNGDVPEKPRFAPIGTMTIPTMMNQPEETRGICQDIVDGLVTTGAFDRMQLESMTPEEFIQSCEFRLVVDSSVSDQIATGELRRVTLSDGRNVLVDGDCQATDEEIRAALEGEP
jgi:hypothetical protein